tara:strand:- start:88 stop:822 length:735 start_codon:yes stop_codon:yes gene_type:complete
MKIGYCTVNPSFELINKLPQPVLKSVMHDYKNMDVGKCPAVHNIWNNKFSISLPYDIELTYEEKDKRVIIQEDNSSIDTNTFLSAIIINDPKDYTKYPVIQLSLEQFFIADSDCMMTVIPPINEVYKDMWRNIKFVSGSFNIYDWQRNLNFAFEWLNPDKPLIIKKDEPIMYVQFNTPNLKESFTIERIPFKGAVKESFLRCRGARGVIKNNTQELMDYNRIFRPDKLMSKCPYSKFKRLFKKS